MRRTHLRGHANILKRLLIHGSGFNLGLAMPTAWASTPRRLQGRLAAAMTVFLDEAIGGGGDRNPPITRSGSSRDRFRLLPAAPRAQWV